MNVKPIKYLIYVERFSCTTTVYFAIAQRPTRWWSFEELTVDANPSEDELYKLRYEAKRISPTNWKRLEETLKKHLPKSRPALPF